LSKRTAKSEKAKIPLMVPFPYRLQTKLAFALVLVGLIPVLLFAAYTVKTLASLVRETSRSILVATTHDYVDRVDTWIRRGGDQAGMAAQMPVFADAVASHYTPMADWDPLEEDLETLRRRAPVFIRTIGLYDLEGERVLQSPRGGSAINVSEQDWFQIPLLTAEPTFQCDLEDQEGGQLTFSAPLIRGHQPVGIIRISYHLNALQHLLSLLTEVSGGPSFVAIVAGDGTLLACDLPDGIRSSSGWTPGELVPLLPIRDKLLQARGEHILEVEFPYYGSERWTACVHPLEESPWSIAYFLPSERYLAPMRDRIALALFTTGGLVFLLVAMGFVSASVLSRNLHGLIKAARIIAAGDLEIRVPEKSRDEVGLLAKSFNNMTRQLSQRTQALVEARHQAEAASRAKSDFLSVMSHEVRTPLNSVIGYSELLINNPELSDENKASVLAIRRSGNELLEMLNNMLDFTKLEAGKVEVDFVPFTLLGLFSDIIEHTAAEAARKGLEIVLEPVGSLPERVNADGPKIRQILLNLVFNALKFTSEGGVRVFFEVDFKPGRDKGNFLVMIEDTGIGITPEVRKRLFKPFSQGDASITRKYGGTGLGLVISQYLAHACGGELTECSPPKGGASFALSVPVRREAGGDNTLPVAKLHPTLSGSRVFVCSANPVSKAFLQTHLRKAGLRCLSKPEVRFDAVVFDEPSIGREECVQDLVNSVPGLADLPVLQLHPHTHAPAGLPSVSRRLVLAKPVLPHELIAQMNALLSAENFVNHSDEQP
jgi:signal transduction histidine kinase